MKKIILLMIGILMISLFSFAVIAEQGDGNSNGQGNAVSVGDGSDNSNGIEIGLNLRERLKVGVEEVVENQLGNKLKLKLMENNRIRLKTGDVEANCDCELTEEFDSVQNRTKLKLKLSNGRNAEVKVMPDTASEIALARLRLKVCSAENNCSIELKEVGKGEGNKTRVAYEIQIQRHHKLLGMFRIKAQNRVQIDAENGEIIIVKKPWWAFLASDVEEEETTE